MTDSLGPNGSPFYSKIVFRDLLEMMMKRNLHSKNIENTNSTSFPCKLMEFINEHRRVKIKCYPIDKYIMNDFKEPNKTMLMILKSIKVYF
jgi:hypothetical protein